jgi:hypothetical protein
MAKSPSPKHIAVRICKAVYALKGYDLHWVSVGDVCKHLDERHTKQMDVALEYARDHDLLACNPAPVHSVMLTSKGVIAARGKFKKSHRDSG